MARNKLFVVFILMFTFALTGCSSAPVEGQLNRSLLLDTGFKLGGSIPALPFPLPQLDLGFHIDFRRPSIQEEIDLNLSKQGKWRGMELPKPAAPISSPTPFPASGDKK